MEADRNGVSGTMSPPVGTSGPGKRKRSDDGTLDAPPARLSSGSSSSKNQAGPVGIDYLSRRLSEDVLLVSKDDSMPQIDDLITKYEGIVHRHESMASNMGVKLLGQTLINRFEKIFHAPVKVIQTNSKEATSVSWADVAEFCEVKPREFILNTVRNGDQFCQFWIKGCRVEISEEDFDLIKSGRPQKILPPQPVPEDEERELGTLQVLMESLQEVIGLADAVSGRARMLNQRLRERKNTTMSRKPITVTVNGASPANTGNADFARPSPNTNGTEDASGPAVGDTHRQSPSPSLGFVAVNSRNSTQPNGSVPKDASPIGRVSPELQSYLLQRFTSLRQANQSKSTQPTPRATLTPTSKVRHSVDTMEHADHLLNTISSVPISGASPTTLTAGRGSPSHADGGGEPFKAKMVALVDSLNKGDRIDPPCDRCRRLPNMECRKNLTACMGCTRKHARCAWTKVTEDELNRSRSVSLDGKVKETKEGQPVEDADDEAGSGHDATEQVEIEGEREKERAEEREREYEPEKEQKKMESLGEGKENTVPVMDTEMVSV
ncbi:MAG: hypothetical protein M1833_006978 [Piccolia ochrophora]|nr:MAG: hypothetical protein M1833_006978 [Piccolia ochrophora]